MGRIPPAHPAAPRELDVRTEWERGLAWPSARRLLWAGSSRRQPRLWGLLLGEPGVGSQARHLGAGDTLVSGLNGTNRKQRIYPSFHLLRSVCLLSAPCLTRATHVSACLCGGEQGRTKLHSSSSLTLGPQSPSPAGVAPPWSTCPPFRRVEVVPSHSPERVCERELPHTEDCVSCPRRSGRPPTELCPRAMPGRSWGCPRTLTCSAVSRQALRGSQGRTDTKTYSPRLGHVS